MHVAQQLNLYTFRLMPQMCFCYSDLVRQ